MARARPVSPLGPLERTIMDVLWENGAVSAVELHRLLSKREVAYTTVTTELVRLVEKKLVSREGRYQTARYRAAIDRERHAEAVVVSAIEGLVGTYGRAAIHGFLDVVGDDPAALAEIRNLLKERNIE